MLSVYCICIANVPGHSLFRMSARSGADVFYIGCMHVCALECLREVLPPYGADVFSIVRICKHKYTQLYQAPDF